MKSIQISSKNLRIRIFTFCSSELFPEDFGIFPWKFSSNVGRSWHPQTQVAEHLEDAVQKLRRKNIIWEPLNMGIHQMALIQVSELLLFTQINGNFRIRLIGGTTYFSGLCK